MINRRHFQRSILVTGVGSLLSTIACRDYTCHDTATCPTDLVDGGRSVDVSTDNTDSVAASASTQPTFTGSSSRKDVTTASSAPDPDSSSPGTTDPSSADAGSSTEVNDETSRISSKDDTSEETRLTLGAGCTGNSQCASGSCVDDVCCQTPCDGPCEACSTEGVCDETPTDDDTCEPVICPASTTCVSYPTAKETDRCASFGECLTPSEYCVPEFAEEETACGSGLECDGAGECVSVCASGEVWCGDACIDPATDSKFCGASADCTASSAGVECGGEAQRCVLGTCKTWTGDLTFAGDGDQPPHLAATDDGDALAAWEVVLDGVKSIHFSRFHTTTETWDPPELVEHVAGAAVHPRVSVGPSGQPVCTWGQDVNDGTGAFAVRTSYRTAQGTWAAHQTLSTPGERALAPALYRLSNAELLAVWSESTTPSAPSSVYAARHTSAGWLPAQPIEAWTDSTGVGGGATDTNGGAVVLLTVSGEPSQLHAQHWNGEEWASQPLASPVGYSIGQSRITHNHQRYLAAWFENSSARKHLRAMWFDGDTWTSAGSIERANDMSFLSIAVSASGRPYLSWAEGSEVVWTTTDPKTGEWLVPKSLVTGYLVATLLSDDIGNIFAFWEDGPMSWQSITSDESNFTEPASLGPMSTYIVDYSLVRLSEHRMLIAYRRSPGDGTSDLGYNFFR